MDHTGPVQVEPPADGARSGLKLTYANGIEMFHGGPAYVTFEGEKGTLYVSRGSIRDAFRTLETIGLLVTRHGQGTFPQELDVDRLVAPLASILRYRHDLQDELLDVRRMFEPAVARVAAARV